MEKNLKIALLGAGMLFLGFLAPHVSFAATWTLSYANPFGSWWTYGDQYTGNVFNADATGTYFIYCPAGSGVITSAWMPWVNRPVLVIDDGGGWYHFQVSNGETIAEDGLSVNDGYDNFGNGYHPYCGTSITVSTALGEEQASSSTTSAVSILGTDTEGETLTGSYPAEASSTFLWLESNASNWIFTPISGATTDAYALTAADVGKYIEFEVMPATGSAGTPMQSPEVGPVNPSSLPVASAVSFTGQEMVGDTLTGSYIYSDSGGHSEASSLFQWLESATQDGTYGAIPGATGETYRLTASDAGQYVEFEVAPVSTVATGIAFTSNPSEQILGAPQ